MLKSHARGGWASDSPTPAQLKEFFSQIDRGRITKEKLQEFLRGSNLKKFQNDQWKLFYKKYFQLELDLSNLKIPAKQPGFNRLIIVAKGLTLNQVYDVCAGKFPCMCYANDLNEAIVKNDRTSNASYAIWLRNRAEADEELKNLSVDKLTEMKISGITLLERLFYELKFWDETDSHLDVENITLCSGSRNSDGDVPCVDWCGSLIRVRWSDSSFTLSSLRARAAVS